MSELNPSEETLFAALSQVPATERAARLDEACGKDAALRARLEALLPAQERAGQFMVRQPVKKRSTSFHESCESRVAPAL